MLQPGWSLTAPTHGAAKVFPIKFPSEFRLSEPVVKQQVWQGWQVLVLPLPVHLVDKESENQDVP